MTRGSESHQASQAPDSVFVGRKPELEELRAGLERASSGRGSIFLVAGEPGIGKSELADRLAGEAAARGGAVLWGRAWEGEGAPPYWPWAQILRAHLADREGTEIFGAATQYVAQLVPELRDRRPDLPTPPPIDSEQARFRLFDAITTFLKSAAAARPLVVILDDLHWADKASLLLLRFLAREMAESRLLVVGTYRDVEVSRGHPLAEVLPSLRQERTVERLLLRGLPEADVRHMLSALRGEAVPEPLARAISRETEGNPFFIQEIVRHLIDEGVLGRDGTAWSGRSRIEDMRLPESIRDVIGRRLGRLSTECTKLLSAASVLGREFGRDALERIADLEEERLVEALEEAVAARVVDDVPETIGRYRFSHTLIRETLYEELRTLDRVRRHQRVAEVLEVLYARNPAPHLAELAHHFLETLPSGNVEKAVDYATRAGDRANEQVAYEEAAIHYDRALQALELRGEPDERLRCELLLKLGEARWSVGGFEKTLEIFQEVAEVAERLGEPEVFARAALAFAGPGLDAFAFWGDESPVPLLKRALAALDERDGALRAQVMGRLAVTHTVTGNLQLGSALLRAAIEMARRVGDRRALGYVLSVTPWAAWGPDNLEERVPWAEELIHLAGEIGDGRLAAEGHAWRASYFLEVGDLSGADREAESQERFAETSRHAYHRWVAIVHRGGRALIEGHFEEADKNLAGAVRAASEPHRGDALVASRGIVSLLREQQGRVDEVLPGVTSLAVRYPRVVAWRAAAAVHRMMLGQTEEARRLFESLAANNFSDIPRDLMWLNIVARLSDVASSLGDARRSAILYDLLLPYADRCVVASSVCRGSASRSLGLLATVLSRYDDAERHFEQALEMNARIRGRIWVAHTQHDYARMLVARDRPGDREKAASLAAAALATAREVGMKPLEAKVLELRAAAGLGGDGESPVELPPPIAAPAVFQQDGDFWTIAYEGKRLRLRDAKGLQYIAHLLRHQGREFHAMELGAPGEAEVPPEAVVDAEVSAGLGDAGEVLDAQARSDYRQRLEDLRSELEEATRWGDSGRADKLREEIEFLTEELSGAYGLGGRARKAGDVANRARKAVTSRIRETITRIGKDHPALGRHLENAIRTGIFCSYQPDRSPEWSF